MKVRNVVRYKSEELIDKETPIIFHDKNEVLKEEELFCVHLKKEISNF
jgi:hypothetical protein